MANKKFNKKRRGRPKVKTDSKIPENIQDFMTSDLDDDFFIAKQNMDEVNKDFDEYYNMIHCVRENRDNDWESNVALPEFVSRILTQVGNFVAKYFSSRDYVETDEDEGDAKTLAQAKVAKDLLNSILNDSESYYFQKIVRLLMFCWPAGWAVVKGGYEQRVERYVSGYKTKVESMVDEDGNFLAQDGGIYEDSYTQKPGYSEVQEPIYDINVVKDRPVFDVYPNQNVYFSPEYAYSLNDKEYVVFENDSMTLDDLENSDEDYFNLHLLKQMKSSQETTGAGDETWNKDGKFKDIPNPPSPKFRVLEWWRKYPVLVKQRDPDTNKPVEYSPGVDKDGDLKDNAELLECKITTATKLGVAETTSTLIGFEVSRHSRRPMARFLCYVDALNDTGFGDGELTMQLSSSIDDNFNLGNFRTKLATTPAFKAKRFAGVPDKIKVSPEEAIMVENMDDLAELPISDNIQGSLYQHSMLSSRMDAAMATSNQTMGQSPDRAETATQAGIISQRAETRIGMKSTMLEFVGFTEFYQMLLTLCNDFMLPQTLEKLVGEEAYLYNPGLTTRFRPVSQSLETEESKNFKMKMIDQIMGRVVNFPNPKTPMVLNYLMGMWLEAAGKNFKHFKKFMFSEDAELNLLYQLVTGGSMPMQQSPDMGGGGPSNQQGIPQSTPEQNVRAAR
ncbi:MAG: hypothetical protein ACYSU8_06395 [Planctomycetota bacterium]|jgi:hypothetical protein